MSVLYSYLYQHYSIVVKADSRPLCPGPNLRCHSSYLCGLGQVAQCLKPRSPHLQNANDICTSLSDRNTENIRSVYINESLSTASITQKRLITRGYYSHYWALALLPKVAEPVRTGRGASWLPNWFSLHHRLLLFPQLKVLALPSESHCSWKRTPFLLGSHKINCCRVQQSDPNCIKYISFH